MWGRMWWWDPGSHMRSLSQFSPHRLRCWIWSLHVINPCRNTLTCLCVWRHWSSCQLCVTTRQLCQRAPGWLTEYLHCTPPTLICIILVTSNHVFISYKMKVITDVPLWIESWLEVHQWPSNQTQCYVDIGGAIAIKNNKFKSVWFLRRLWSCG